MPTDRAAARGTLAFVVCSLAVLYGIGFLVWAVAIPDYPHGRTFIDLSDSVGLGLLLASQSLLVSVPVWLLLRRYCLSGEEWTGALAVWLAAPFLGWAILGGFSLAFGTFPAACLLVAGVALTPRGASPAG
jgi:hypothetical protein